MQNSMGELDGVHRQRCAVTATVIEQLTVPALEIHRRQIGQSDRADVRQHVALQHVAIVRPGGDRQFRFHRVDPRVEELANCLLGRSDVGALLQTSERLVQRCLRFAFRDEVSDLALLLRGHLVDSGPISEPARHPKMGSELA